MDFSIAEQGHFKVTHCYDCLIPGYLIVSPKDPVLSICVLPRNAQEELGFVLATATEAIQSIIAPRRIYCAQFGEESEQLHFHVFPRTNEITAEFLRAFPEQQTLIHGPVLLDWARTVYRAPESEVWASVSPIIPKLREEFSRITNRSDRTRANKGRAG